MPVLLNASRRCWMADREIGVPGGRMAVKRTDRNVCATGGGGAAALRRCMDDYFSCWFLRELKREARPRVRRGISVRRAERAGLVSGRAVPNHTMLPAPERVPPG